MEAENDLEQVSPDKNVEQEERAELEKYVAELNEKIKQKSELRQQNVTKLKRPTEDYFFKLDSSLKKNTAFVKKLKQFTAAQLESLVKDMSSLNLTKYISEVTSAIVETKLKMSDIAGTFPSDLLKYSPLTNLIPAILILCSKLHQIYGDFSQSLFESWQKILMIKPGEKIANPSKMRVDLRFYCELISIGIFSNKVR
jgi:regulator of nonsense transcripts 2